VYKGEVWVRVRPPPVPVTVTVTPEVRVAELLAERLKVAVPLVLTLALDGLTVTPLGRPLKLRFTEPLKPLLGVTVTLRVTGLPPRMRSTRLLLRLRAKSGAGITSWKVSEAASPAVSTPFTLRV